MNLLLTLLSWSNFFKVSGISKSHLKGTTMKKEKKERSVPKWVLRNLRVYGNCSCGYDLIKKYGEKRLLQKLIDFGFDCSLRIVPDPDARCRRKMKYPPSAYYILEVDKVLKTTVT